MISYRTFRNDDPPRLLELWNGCFAGRGAAELRGTMLLEYLTFAKPYFDPAGLTLAESDGAAVGFVHAGFGPDAGESALDRTTGVVSALGVLPDHRGRGVGGELLRRAEEYLKGRGATTAVAGPLGWLNPFTFALYGGSQAAGLLDSDLLAAPFFAKRGYAPAGGARVYHRRLEQFLGVADGRFGALRGRYEIHGGPWRKASWWRECVVGPVEVQELVLQEKAGGRVAGRALAWVMDTFSQRWGEQAVGLLNVEVEADLRRRGLARFLVSSLLRHFHEQYFTLAEVQVPTGDAAEGLFRGLGFEPADEGRQYRKAL